MTEFSYEFPHDKRHRLKGVEVAPHTYTVTILDTEVTVEFTPSRRALSASFSTCPTSTEYCIGTDINGVLKDVHVAIYEYRKRVAHAPLRLEVGGVAREFSLNTREHFVSWEHRSDNIIVTVYQHEPDNYSVSAYHKNKGSKIWANGDGKTPQEALAAWEASMREETTRTEQRVVDMRRLLDGHSP